MIQKDRRLNGVNLGPVLVGVVLLKFLIDFLWIRAPLDLARPLEVRATVFCGGFLVVFVSEGREQNVLLDSLFWVKNSWRWLAETFIQGRGDG